MRNTGDTASTLPERNEAAKGKESPKFPTQKKRRWALAKNGAALASELQLSSHVGEGSGGRDSLAIIIYCAMRERRRPAEKKQEQELGFRNDTRVLTPVGNSDVFAPSRMLVLILH